jgi:hypothetical protein
MNKKPTKKQESIARNVAETIVDDYDNTLDVEQLKQDIYNAIIEALKTPTPCKS